MDPFLSIIIPTYNRADKLDETLRRLHGQSLSQEAYEILVVDDGSTDHTQELLKKWASKSSILKNHRQTNQGQGPARNGALQKARGQIVLFIGDDIYATPDFLLRHSEFHQQNPPLESACLGLTEWDPDQEITLFMKWMVNGGYQFNYSKLIPNQPASFWYFYTSNLSLKKDLLATEHFDEDFKGYGWEDIELGYRLTQKFNLQIYYTPSALAFHDHRLEESSLPEKMKALAKNGKIFESKHPKLKVLPQGIKKTALTLLTLAPVRGLLAILKPFSKIALRAHWYCTAKHYFLKSLRSI